MDQVWQRGVSLIRGSFLGRSYSHFTYHLYEWWYPAASTSHDYPGYSGRRRLSRSTLVLHHLLSRISASFLGRWYAKITYRLYEWWYPVTGDADAYSGYARRRKSRLAILLSRVQRKFSDSRLGRRCSQTSYHLYEWWYPPLEPAICKARITNTAASAFPC